MPSTGSLFTSADVVLHVPHHRLVDAVAFVRRAAERHLDHRVDREERNLGLVRRAPDLIVGDDALGRQDHLVRRHREVDVHELQAVDLRVAVSVAALDVDQRHVRIERRHEQELLARERAVDLLRFRPLLAARRSRASSGSA